MRRMLLCVLALAGCDKVFGLDKDVKPAPAQANFLVEGHYYQHWYDFDPGAAIVLFERNFPPDQIMDATATFGDGTTSPVTFTDSGFSFGAPAAGQRYTLSLQMPLGARTWNIVGDTPLLIERYISPPDNPVASANTTVTASVSARAIGTEETVTLGSWSRSNASFMGFQKDDVLDVSAIDNAGHQIGPLVKASVFYTVTQSVTQSAYTYNHITMFGEATGVSTNDGASVPEMVTVNATSGSLCTSVVLNSDLESSRNTTAIGGGGLTTSSWEIDQSPALDFSLIGPFLPVASGTASSTTNVNAMYDNIYALPFVTRLSTTAYNLSSSTLASTTEISVPAGNCTTPSHFPAPTDANGTVQLPIDVAVNNNPIESDNQMFTLPPSDTIPISWRTSGGSGVNAGGYIVFVDEVPAPNHRLNVAQVMTTELEADIPTSIFQPKKSYLIQVAAVLGFPNAAQGDFKTIAMDVVGIGAFQTRTFIIQ